MLQFKGLPWLVLSNLIKEINQDRSAMVKKERPGNGICTVGKKN